jgi:hypothetical protein
VLNESRGNYYGIAQGEEPVLEIDGTYEIHVENPSGYYSAYNDNIQYAKGAAPIFNLYADAYIDSTDSTIGNVYLRIVTTDTLPPDSITACIVICQDSVDGAYKNFNYICKQFYSFPINLVFPDSTDTTITFTHSLLASKLKAVAFAQDVNTKEILQAITTKFRQ